MVKEPKQTTKFTVMICLFAGIAVISLQFFMFVFAVLPILSCIGGGSKACQSFSLIIKIIWFIPLIGGLLVYLSSRRWKPVINFLCAIYLIELLLVSKLMNG